MTAHEYGDNKNGITLAKAETHTVPQGFMEQQNYNNGLKTAKSATQQSGMSQEQSEKVSVGLAEQSVRTPQLANAISHVQNNGGFNSEQGRTALTQASQAGSPQEAIQIIENYGKSVNATPTPAPAATHGGSVSGSSFTQGNVSVSSTSTQTKANSAAASIVANSGTTENASVNGTTTTTQTATVTTSQPQAAQATTQAQTKATRVAQAVSSNNNSSSIT